MRGFDQEHGCQTLMDGFRVHYNLVKTHQSLGCTPTEQAGITIEGDNKWETLMKTSLAYQRYIKNKN